MTHTVKSIAVSIILLVSALRSSAGIWGDSHKRDLYTLYEQQEFRDRADDTCNANWKTYLGMGDSEYFYFRIDEVKEKAAQLGDQLMSSYLDHLDLYLQCAREVSNEQWNYPTKEQLAQRRQTLLKVKNYAQGKLRTKLRSQHALLYMRCNMLLGQHRENVTFWEQTANAYIWTVYKDMMRDIYAGALLHTGRADEAGQIFAELGDWQSLMTQYYERRSCQAISEEYARDPNSAVLPFLLQDFVNNAQEAVDVYDEGWGTQGKLFIRDIQKSEAMQMCQLARKAVSEGRTRQPIIWQSALAWLEYLFGNQLMARADIGRTASMEGTERMKNCARVLRLYISTATASKSDPTLDAHLAEELKWIDTMSKDDDYYHRAKDRIVHQVLAKRYTDAGRTGTALSLLRSVGDYSVLEYIDTMSIANLKKLIAYKKHPGSSPIDTYAAPQLELNDTAMNDLMGTKHMRLCQWKEAQEWLKRVPPTYYSQKGYAPYAAHRSWAVEPWIKRQWLKDEVVYSDTPVTLRLNPKLAFAAEMETLEQELNVLNRDARQKRCYDLAIRYAQATYTGDCWFLLSDAKSITDSVRANETDFLAKARTLLKEASQTADQKLKERVLFALAYSGLYPEDQIWYTTEWSSEESKYLTLPRTESLQYKAFAALATFNRFSKAPESDYVSMCDEYIQFKKRFK